MMRTLAFIAMAGACASQPWGRAHAIEQPAVAVRTIDVSVAREFWPKQLTARVGEVVRLRFTRTTPRSCAREVIVSLDGKHTIRRDLPVGTPVEVTLAFDKPGELGFTCGMGMLGATIDVQR